MVKLLCSHVLLRILGRGQTNPFATKRPWFSDLPNPLIWFCVWVHTKKMDDTCDTIKIRVVYHQVPHEKGTLIIGCIHLFLHILNPYQYFSNQPGTPWNHHFCTGWYRKVLRRHDEFPSNFRLISPISSQTDTDCIIIIATCHLLVARCSPTLTIEGLSPQLGITGSDVFEWRYYRYSLIIPYLSALYSYIYNYIYILCWNKWNQASGTSACGVCHVKLHILQMLPCFMHVSGKAIVSFPVTVLTDPEICKDRQPRRPLPPPLSKGFRWVGAGVFRSVQDHSNFDILKISIPICSMYGIFTNIYPKNHPNVGKYTIHGAYGIHTWTTDTHMLSNFHLFRIRWFFCHRQDVPLRLASNGIHHLGSSNGGLYSGYIYIYVRWTFMYYLNVCMSKGFYWNYTSFWRIPTS